MPGLQADPGLTKFQEFLLLRLLPNGAASKSDVRSSDIILRVNGDLVTEANQLQEKVAMFRPNERITLTLWRDRREIERDVVLEEIQPIEEEPLPDTFDEEMIEPGPDFWEEIPENGRGGGIEQQSFRELGFSIRALATPEDPDRYNLYLHRVQRGSEAWNRGLRSGSEIIELNGNRVYTIEEAEKEITDSMKNNRSLTIKIQTEDGSTGFYQLN
jgi:serine protease Do